MTCDVTKERLMDFLYEELGPEEHEKMEPHIADRLRSQLSDRLQLGVGAAVGGE